MRMVSPVESARQFCDAINRQLDFRREAANNLRFRANFAGESYVVFPHVYENLSSARVLTMEYLEGYRERDLVAVGIDPKKVAGLGMRVFCKMTFIDGFIHADLHPGNIRFMRDNRIALFDLGLTAELTDEDRLMFAQTMFYMANGMGRELAKQMYDLTQHNLDFRLRGIRARDQRVPDAIHQSAAGRDRNVGARSGNFSTSIAATGCASMAATRCSTSR